MLEIREQILNIVKEKKRLSLSEDKELFHEIIEFRNGQFIYYKGNSLSNSEEQRYSLTPKQALAKICEFYRKKGGINIIPEYNEIYKFMKENPSI